MARIRFQTVLAKDELKTLGDTADELSVSKSEVLRRALRLYRMVNDLRASGKGMLAVVQTKGANIQVKELIPWDVTEPKK